MQMYGAYVDQYPRALPWEVLEFSVGFVRPRGDDVGRWDLSDVMWMSCHG